jgi:RNA polymerase sigma-70 factor (ECF subfamily)
VGPSEHVLVWRLRRGDRDACRELIRVHHAAVYGYLRRLGADASRAEDLTQDTYLRAWRSIESIRRAASLRSWLLTIARNEFFQRMRVGRIERRPPGGRGRGSL